MGPVTDARDIRVLIPRARRTLDGPTATGSAAVSSKLSDDQLTAVIADAIADVIFYSSGAFGRQLEVTEREEVYMAPSAWRTSEALTEEEITVILAQASLNYVFTTLQEMKTSETNKEADREWSWSISANALSDRVKELRGQRDRALELLASSDAAPAERWVNLLYERDAYTDVLIEPYATAGLLPSGEYARG